MAKTTQASFSGQILPGQFVFLDDGRVFVGFAQDTPAEKLPKIGSLMGIKKAAGIPAVAVRVVENCGATQGGAICFRCVLVSTEPTRIEVEGLDVDLPPAWIDHVDRDGSRDFRPTPDGSSGTLQVSLCSDAEFARLSSATDLGKRALDYGRKVGGHKPISSQNDKGPVGRVGFALFGNKKHPTMFLFVTVGGRSAHVWKWLGTTATTDNDEEHLVHMVFTARERMP